MNHNQENPARGICYASLFSLIVWIGGCLCLPLATGCRIMTAQELLGVSNPKVKIKKTWSGIDIECGTNFAGTAKGEYNPETKKITFDVSVNSDVSGVVKAEGDRAVQISPTMMYQMDMQVKLHEQVGKNLESAGRMIATAMVGGGEAVAKAVDAVAPILKGSAANIAGFGLQLGTPEAAPEPARPTTDPH